MSDEPRAKELFLDALEQAPEERAAFVASACRGDANLSARVEALLSAHARAERRLPEACSVPFAPGLAFARHAARAAALAGAGADAALTRACDARVADALLDAGEAAEAEELARRVRDGVLADADAAPAARAEARLRLGLALAALGRNAEARAELEAGLAESSAPLERRAWATAVLAGLANLR